MYIPHHPQFIKNLQRIVLNKCYSMGQWRLYYSYYISKISSYFIHDFYIISYYILFRTLYI